MESAETKVALVHTVTDWEVKRGYLYLQVDDGRIQLPLGLQFPDQKSTFPLQLRVEIPIALPSQPPIE